MGSSLPTSLAPLPGRAIVVGASSGIGAACAVELAKRGYQIALVARRQEELETVAEKCDKVAGKSVTRVYLHDVMNITEVPELFDRIGEEMGGIGLVIYASGTMGKRDVEGYDTLNDAQIVAVNLMGAIAWLNEAADLFTRLKSGTIIGVSSIAGERGRRKNGVYGATKAGFSQYLESLRNRLSQYGVRVVTIKPGYVDTEMVKSIKDPLWLISAEEAGRRIVESASRGPETLFVPRRWGLVAWVMRNMPSEFFRHLSI